MYFRLKGKGRLIRKGVESLVHEGPRITWMRVRRKTRKAFENANMLKRPLFTNEELAAQRADQFPPSHYLQRRRSSLQHE